MPTQKNQGLNHSRNTIIKRLYEKYNLSKKDISIIHKIRDELAEGSAVKGLMTDKDDFKLIIKNILEILGFECSLDTIHKVIYSNKPDNTNYSYYD